VKCAGTLRSGAAESQRESPHRAIHKFKSKVNNARLESRRPLQIQRQIQIQLLALVHIFIRWRLVIVAGYWSAAAAY
jgi:hypothetical protein